MILVEFDEEMKRQKALTKKLAINEINNWIKAMPEEKRKQIVAAVGTKSFTPEQLLREVEEDTEYGKQLVKMFDKLRIELSRKKEDQ